MEPVKKAVKKSPAKKPAAKRTAKVAADQVPAEVVIAAENPKTLVFMKTGASYVTPSGVLFTKSHPFQLVDFFESKTLIDMPEDRFRLAKPEEAREYYGQ
jgi:hypothetical protein